MPNVSRFAATTLTCLGFVPLLISAIPPLPVLATEADPSSESVDRVVERLPSDTQSILLTCQEQGGVDLVAGANPEGTVVCGDGAAAPIEYDRYLTTASDFMAAGVLIGFRSVMLNDPRVSPDLLITLLATQEGANVIRGATETAITQSSLVTSSSESVSLLTDEVMRRLLPTFNSTNNLDTLLGTEEQYESVVQNFCTSPGLSLEQTQQAVPGLIPIQLFAICIDASRAIPTRGSSSSGR